MTEQATKEARMHDWVIETLTEEVPDFFERTESNSEAGRVGPSIAIMAATRNHDVVALSLADHLFSEELKQPDFTPAQQGELRVFRDFARYARYQAEEQPTPRVLPGIATIYNLLQDGGDDEALGDFAEVAKTNVHTHMRNKTTDSLEYGISHGLMKVALEAYDNTYKLSRLRQPGMAPFWHQILSHAIAREAQDSNHGHSQTPSEIAADIGIDHQTAHEVSYMLRNMGYLYTERLFVRKDPDENLEWAVSTQPVASELLELVRTNAIARLRSGLPENMPS